MSASSRQRMGHRIRNDRTEKSTGHISASSQSSIAALKDVLADGRLTQRGGGLNFVDFIFRGIE